MPLDSNPMLLPVSLLASDPVDCLEVGPGSFKGAVLSPPCLCSGDLSIVRAAIQLRP
jgi:hypothetical protein